MIKQLFSTGALALALSVCTAPVVRAQTETKSDNEKTKTKEGDSVTKTKVQDDGKTKMKGKSGTGDKMKSKAKPTDGSMGGTTGGMETSNPAGMDNATSGTSAGVMVGGAMMMPDKDIVMNASASNEHSTLVSAVKAADLVATLQGPGPYTVFAPTNAAFDKLPTGTVNNLMMPANKTKLSTILTYHVVPGRLLAADLKDGQVLTTVEGENLTVHRNGDMVTIHDAKGGMANVTIPNVVSSNGITHVVDAVLMPTR
ncbi:fasciclin domain-containing protein [Hymenobacter sp. BT730]|uniref:fasciclin domain-containing protein n=1 Tax=Hymenobacter sp. BT730 TaxID=3063332 RepID=UPI0026DFC8C2|nr:fasciclin domain-containing protein [Hymenobacter sp. BT730]